MGTPDPPLSEWKCVGCGAVSPDRVRSCDCATNCVFRQEDGHQVVEIKIEREETTVVAEFILRDMKNGELWLDVTANRTPYVQVGPFDTATERQRALDDLLKMTRSLGAKDVPLLPQ